MTADEPQAVGAGARRATAAQLEARPGLFEFRSGFWLNLHHALYREAVVRQRGRGEPAGAELDGEERRAWDAAVDHYVAQLVERSLLFDIGMVETKNRLAELGGAPSLSGAGLEPELAAVLESAAPIYRARLWPRHDPANRAFIEHVGPLAAAHADLARELAAAYREPWPEEPVAVDVSVYAGWAGAYTTLRPLHLTIAASDPRHRGEAALEILFHEASHGLVGTIQEALERELRARDKLLPRDDRWHALLFYTTGELVRRRLPGYAPYAEAQGLWREGPWGAMLPALREHWQPYVDGKVDFETAIARLVGGLPETPPPGPT